MTDPKLPTLSKSDKYLNIPMSRNWKKDNSVGNIGINDGYTGLTTFGIASCVPVLLVEEKDGKTQRMSMVHLEGEYSDDNLIGFKDQLLAGFNNSDAKVKRKLLIYGQNDYHSPSNGMLGALSSFKTEEFDKTLSELGVEKKDVTVYYGHKTSFGYSFKEQRLIFPEMYDFKPLPNAFNKNDIFASECSAKISEKNRKRFLPSLAGRTVSLRKMISRNKQVKKQPSSKFSP